MLTAQGSFNGPALSSRCSVSCGSDSGMSRQSYLATPMSTATMPFSSPSASSTPARVSIRGEIAALLLHQQRRDAARRVAAGRHLAAVGVADAHEGVGVAVLRRLDHDQLVAPDAQMPVGDAPRLRLAQRDGMVARVDHDEVVAEPVHLGEGEFLHVALIWPTTEPNPTLAGDA